MPSTPKIFSRGQAPAVPPYHKVPPDQVPPYSPNRPPNRLPTCNCWFAHMPYSMLTLLRPHLKHLTRAPGKVRNRFYKHISYVAWPMVTNDSFYCYLVTIKLINCPCHHGADGLLKPTAVFCFVLSWRHNNDTLGIGTVWRMTSFAVVQSPVAVKDRVLTPFLAMIW